MCCLVVLNNRGYLLAQVIVSENLRILHGNEQTEKLSLRLKAEG